MQDGSLTQYDKVLICARCELNGRGPAYRAPTQRDAQSWARLCDRGLNVRACLRAPTPIASRSLRAARVSKRVTVVTANRCLTVAARSTRAVTAVRLPHVRAMRAQLRAPTPIASRSLRAARVSKWCTGVTANRSLTVAARSTRAVTAVRLPHRVSRPSCALRTQPEDHQKPTIRPFHIACHHGHEKSFREV